MFSTQISMPVFALTSRTMRSKSVAYVACHRNGGCTTTDDAPTSAASSADLRSLTPGSRPHTLLVSSSTGAWMARIGIEYLSLSASSGAAVWVAESLVTMTSMPS